MNSFALSTDINPATPIRSSRDRDHISMSNLPTHFLETNQGRIAYDDAGSGPLVVMLPSLGDIRQEYRFLRPKLVAAGYRVVTMDLRGLGESSANWPTYSASSMGADLLALLHSLDDGPATLIGTSMGAAAVAWVAAEAPALVDKLVLVDPFVRADPPQSGLQLAFLKVVMAVAFAGPWRVWAWSKYYDSLYPTQKPEDHDAYLKALAANLREPGRFAATKAMMSVSKADVEPRLAEIRAWSLVVMGSKDPDFPDPKAEAELVAKLIGGADIAMIEGAGHYPHAEMPDRAAEAILAHLQAKG